MSSLFHSSDVNGVGVTTLAVSDGVDKPVGELLERAQQVGLDKIHHGIVCGRKAVSYDKHMCVCVRVCMCNGRSPEVIGPLA